MLVRLSISDFAIIRHLEIDFHPGLNILSGETGAGKSIIINAVNLLLGGRATAELIREGAEEARVEGLFQIPESSTLPRVLEDMDVPFGGELLIKRTISRSGKNRVTINGSIATVAMLASIGPRLLAVSGQHASQALLKPENHLLLLDEFGGLEGERESFSQDVRRFKALAEEIARLRGEISLAKERQELARFQAEEIDSARVRLGEDQELEQEKRRLKSAEELFKIAQSSFAVLYDQEDAVLSRISKCLRDLERGAGIDPQLSPAVDTLKRAAAEVEDASYTLREYLDDIGQDPERLEQIEDRLFLLNQLKRKYGPTLEDVIAYRERICGRAEEIERSKILLGEKEKNFEQLRERIASKGNRLSQKRKGIAKRLERAMERELSRLHMRGTVFKIHFQSVPGPERGGQRLNVSPEFIREEGFDQVEFMISPNIGEPLRPLAKIASGGELSRVVLALKSVLASKASVETVVFDEVDSGISGATAEIVGEKLLNLSNRHQILCITHLPQIASKGKAHFLVKKQVEAGRTITTISELNRRQRVMEIARLLGGKEITQRAISRAEEMLSPD
ncbi:MAG: DNA repair protein RecN [Deltaproteobacteria bacterium]|nr:MAG: DNA repair protein RecN [Deltaproteobacteria bacterium]